MVAKPLVFSSGVVGVVALTGTTETVVATCGGCVTRYAGQTFKIRGQSFITTGANQTGVILRIRQQSLTGTLVNDQTAQTIVTAGGDSDIYHAFGTDTPGDVTGYTYVLTAQQAGGSNNGATVYSDLEVRVD